MDQSNFHELNPQIKHNQRVGISSVNKKKTAAKFLRSNGLKKHHTQPNWYKAITQKAFN